MEKPVLIKKALIVFILVALCLFLFSEHKFLDKESARYDQMEKKYGVEMKKPSTEE